MARKKKDLNEVEDTELDYENNKNYNRGDEGSFSLDDDFEDDLESIDDYEDDTTVPELKVGIIGYSNDDFDVDEARVAIENILDDIESDYITNGIYGSIVLVSGGTNLGIPKLAYEVASERGHSTMAVVPEQARSHELFDVDEIIWVGDKFGDESETFVNVIDVLVKIGGGDQSNNEVKMADEKDIPVHEFDL